MRRGKEEKSTIHVFTFHFLLFFLSPFLRRDVSQFDAAKGATLIPIFDRFPPPLPPIVVVRTHL